MPTCLRPRLVHLLPPVVAAAAAAAGPLHWSPQRRALCLMPRPVPPLRHLVPHPHLLADLVLAARRAIHVAVAVLPVPKAARPLAPAASQTPLAVLPSLAVELVGESQRRGHPVHSVLRMSAACGPCAQAALSSAAAVLASLRAPAPACMLVEVAPHFPLACAGLVVAGSIAAAYHLSASQL